MRKPVNATNAQRGGKRFRVRAVAATAVADAIRSVGYTAVIGPAYCSCYYGDYDCVCNTHYPSITTDATNKIIARALDVVIGPVVNGRR